MAVTPQTSVPFLQLVWPEMSQVSCWGCTKGGSLDGLKSCVLVVHFVALDRVYLISPRPIFTRVVKTIVLVSSFGSNSGKVWER